MALLLPVSLDSLLYFAIIGSKEIMERRGMWESLGYLWGWITPVFSGCCNFIMELVGVILATAKVHFGIEGGQGSEEKEEGESVCHHLVLR